MVITRRRKKNFNSKREITKHCGLIVSDVQIAYDNDTSRLTNDNQDNREKEQG